MVSPEGSYGNNPVINKKWEGIKKAITDVGGEVIVIESSQHGEYKASEREVFVRDPVFVIGDRAIVMDYEFDDAELASEQGPLVEVLQSLGYNTEKVPIAIDGGNLIYDPDKDVILMGYNSHDDFPYDEMEILQDAAGTRVLPVPFTGQGHLDTHLNILPNGHVVYKPKEWLAGCPVPTSYSPIPERALEMLGEIYGRENMHELPPSQSADAEDPCNFIVIGGTVITGSTGFGERIENILHYDGYGIMKTSSSITHDGGIRCATLVLNSGSPDGATMSPDRGIDESLSRGTPALSVGQP